MSFTNKVAIVTGGGQGIGKAIVRRFLEAKLRVMVAEVDAEAGAETIAEYKDLGTVRFVQTDVANEASVQQMVRETIAQFGRLDILVNNAAIANPENPPIEEMSLEDWNRIIRTNLTGLFLCTKHAVPPLRSQGGVIINLASVRATMSEPNTEAYSASKGGVVALTHALANSLGPTIRVNCISPGWIEVSEWKKQADRKSPHLTEADHQQHLVGRVGKPEDIASMALYLASDEAGFITGTEFIVDGGMLRKMIYV
ncbi:MAG TPA: glucose 1-dehydrogenase [Trichocoleus sp.]|jgi:NAD(P)-dependent dehydrogenase (short-subunit alcohol dehydrogenase family)